MTNSDAVKAMLKTWYAKEGVQNLMFRNSPLLKKLEKVRVEGKTQNFSAMLARGGAVAGNFNTAKKVAANTAQAVEFAVVPGQIFSVYTMNAREVQASVSKRGAYMKVAGAKMFAAAEGFRKTLAAALYGSGYGEIAKVPVSTSTETVELPTDAVLKLDIGSRVAIKANLTDDDPALDTDLYTVVEIDNNSVKFDKAITGKDGHYICLAGCVDNGQPLLPVGLGGWLPTDRTMANPFFGVNRKQAKDRLGGAFVDGSSKGITETIQELIATCRRQGSIADMIVMNDLDFLALSKEIESTNTYFTQTSTKGKKSATTGFSELSAAFSTNYIDNIIDDPYCPRGVVYVLDSTAVELWSYTNVEKKNDGIEGNNPGKQDPMTMENEGDATNYGLIIDDYLNVQPGDGSINGPDMQVTLQFFGSFAVTNPSTCGVAKIKVA